jgi:hypothetical protein
VVGITEGEFRNAMHKAHLHALALEKRMSAQGVGVAGAGGRVVVNEGGRNGHGGTYGVGYNGQGAGQSVSSRIGPSDGVR